MSHRTVTPTIKLLQTISRGRQLKEALRYQEGIVTRSQRPPSIPGGPYHKLHKISYYARDARREVQPPAQVIFESEVKQLGTRNEQAAIPSK